MLALGIQYNDRNDSLESNDVRASYFFYFQSSVSSNKQYKFAHWFLIVQWQVREFERNGVNLTMSKREEMEKLKSQIDELSLQYVHNLNSDNSFILLSEPELVGMPPQFIKVSYQNFYHFTEFILLFISHLLASCFFSWIYYLYLHQS